MAAALQGTRHHRGDGPAALLGGALPYEHEIAGDQPDHARLQPGAVGAEPELQPRLFRMEAAGAGYDITMDARRPWRAPPVDMAKMQIVDRPAPALHLPRGWWRRAVDRGARRAGPARRALAAGAASGANMPPTCSSSLAAAQGIRIGGRRTCGRAPFGSGAGRGQSDQLHERGAADAEVFDQPDGRGAGADGVRPAQHARPRPRRWTPGWRRRMAQRPKMVDHSGLGAASRVTVEDMMRVMVGAGPQGPLLPILKEIPLGKGGRSGVDMQVHAKTGTLNFVSCLTGYARGPDGRMLAFSMMMRRPAPPLGVRGRHGRAAAGRARPGMFGPRSCSAN